MYVSYPLQDEEDLDFREGLDEKPRFIEVVDEDGRVTTLQVTSFDMESSGDDDDEVEEEMVSLYSIHALNTSLHS